MDIPSGLIPQLQNVALIAGSSATPLDAALCYARAGINVLPKRKGHKDSGLEGWQNINVTDPAQIKRWFQTGKYDGLLIKPGQVMLDGQPVHLVLIDYDGERVYQTASRVFPELNNTHTERTGSGKGYRQFLLVDKLPDVGKRKISRKGILDTDDLGLEIFFDSGNVVVAPSVHPTTGNLYTIEHAAPILHVPNIDDFAEWAINLPAKNDKKKRQSVPHNHSGQGDVPADIASAIERALHIEGYDSKGFSNNPVRCLFKNHEHDNTKPAAHWHGDKHFFYCHKCDQSWSAKETAAALGIEWPKKQQKQAKNERPARSSDIDTSSVNLGHSDAITADYIGDKLTPGVIAPIRSLLIDGAVGMGKTTATGKYADTLPEDEPVTAFAPFVLLTYGLAEKFSGMMWYRDLVGKDQALLRNATRFVTTLSSAHKFNRVGGLVIADEIESCLKFLVGSDTFKGGASVEAYRSVKQTISSAKQFIGMEANLSPITEEWVNRQRGDVTVKRFKKAQPRDKVTFLRDKFAALATIQKFLMQQRGQIYVACSSEKTARAVMDYLGKYAQKAIKITRDTSSTAEVEAFVKSADTRRSYDLVIYDPAMPSGVDISEPVYAQIGIFDRVPLTPQAAIQLYGRVRNAQRYFAAVPPLSEGYPTQTKEEILADRLKREYWTAKRTGRTANVSGDYLEMLELWAAYKEIDLRETARWTLYFAARLKDNGYQVAANNARASKPFIDAFKEWDNTRKAEAWDFVREAEGLALDDQSLEKIRLGKQEITYELRLRNLRDKIEKALGHNGVTEHDRDLMSDHGRAALYRLADIFADECAIVEIDAAQADDGTPIQKRSYRTLSRGVFSKIMRMVGIEGSAERQFTTFTDYFRAEHSAAEVAERFAAFTTPECMTLFKALGHYGTNALTITGLCRWIMQHFGIDLKSRRIGRAETRQMTYEIADLEALEYVISRAKTSAKLRKNAPKIIVDRPMPTMTFDEHSQALYDAIPSANKNKPSVLERFKPATPFKLIPGKNCNPFSSNHVGAGDESAA